MSKKNHARITAILNRAKAILAVSGTLTELAAYIGQPSKAGFVKVKRWVDYRSAVPAGEDALAILEWVKAKEAEINQMTSDEVGKIKLQRVWRRALQAANKEFPGTGKK